MNRKLSTMIFALSIVGMVVTLGVATDVKGTTVIDNRVTRSVAVLSRTDVLGEVTVTDPNSVKAAVDARSFKMFGTLNNVEVDVDVEVVNRVIGVSQVDGVTSIANGVDRVESTRAFSRSTVTNEAVRMSKVVTVRGYDNVGEVVLNDVETVVDNVPVAINVRLFNVVNSVRADVSVFKIGHSCFVARGGFNEPVVTPNNYRVSSDGGLSNTKLNRTAVKERRTKWSKKWKRASGWDAQAQQEMRTRMARNGQAWWPVEDTFKKNVEWSRNWELRWWAFKLDNGRTAWVYHRRSKTSGIRYTSVVDTQTGQWDGWQVVR